jgi:hypothetical protein
MGRTLLVATALYLALSCGTARGDWSVVESPNPPFAETSRLLDVSCSADSACTSVGQSAGTWLAERWDGSSWKIQTLPESAGSRVLAGVSCSSGTACTAVGRLTSAGISSTKILRWNGSGWSEQTPATPAGAISTELRDVWCSTTTHCVAVGAYGTTSGDFPMAQLWNGTSWSLQSVPGSGSLTDISCSEVNACTAVGGKSAVRWDGSEWSSQSVPTPPEATSSTILGVSCANANTCVAVGGYIQAVTFKLKTFALHWNGTSWSLQATPEASGTMWAVSCIRSDNCSAVGEASSSTLTEIWNGSIWATEVSANKPGAVKNLLNAVSCAVGCMAVGEYLPGGGFTGTLALKTTYPVYGLRNENSSGSGSADHLFPYGQSGDSPVIGDWNSDGEDTVGTYRPSDSSFHLRNSNSAGADDVTFAYGIAKDIPIAGDWNKDGTDTIGIYRPSTSTFALRNTNSAGSADVSVAFGVPGDIPVVGDWNKDGTDTIGIYRPSTSTFWLRNTNSAGSADVSVAFGVLGDIPAVGDWNKDGTTSVGIFRQP